MGNFSVEFIRFAVEHRVLRFGEFTTKSGRLSPYFFNSGLFHDGASLHQLGQFYAKAINVARLDYDMLYGPAYKGIPLVSAVAIALAHDGRNVGFCFNRKEAKDHGELGSVIGAPLSGRVLIVDDVISAGTSTRASVDIIRAHGATPCGVVIALDRMERGSGTLSAVQEVEQTYDVPVISIANLNDVVDYLQSDVTMRSNVFAIEQYRKRYGVGVHANS